VPDIEKYESQWLQDPLIRDVAGEGIIHSEPLLGITESVGQQVAPRSG